MKGAFSYSFSIQPWALGPQDLCPGKWGPSQQKVRPFSVKVQAPRGTLQPDCEQRCILATQGQGQICPTGTGRRALTEVRVTSLARRASAEGPGCPCWSQGSCRVGKVYDLISHDCPLTSMCWTSSADMRAAPGGLSHTGSCPLSCHPLPSPTGASRLPVPPEQARSPGCLSTCCLPTIDWVPGCLWQT